MPNFIPDLYDPIPVGLFRKLLYHVGGLGDPINGLACPRFFASEHAILPYPPLQLATSVS